MTTTTATATPDPTAQATDAIRTLTLRLGATTDKLKTQFGEALARLRIALDLPSRTELVALAARLDAIEAQLAALAEDDSEDDDKRRRTRRRGS